MIKPDLGSRAFTITVTASGTLIYGVQASSQNVHMARVDFTTGTLLSSPTDVAEHYQVRNSGPDWNADGRLLIVSERPGNVTGLSILPANLKGPIREVIPQMDVFHRPRWAPDGSITVQGTDLAGRSGFFRVDAGSGKTTPVLVCERFGACQQASWTPDEHFLVYRRIAPDEVAMVLRDMVRGEDRVIEPVGRQGTIHRRCQRLARRHEDRYIVQDRPSGRSTLYLRPLAGGGRASCRMPTRPMYSLNVAEWTPDSTRLIVAREPPGRGLWIVPIDGGLKWRSPGFIPRSRPTRYAFIRTANASRSAQAASGSRSGRSPTS